MWRAERAAWVVMIAIVVAALLGIFSNGVLSSVVATARDGSLTVRYDRFVRKTAATRVELRLPPREGASATLTIAPSFLRAFDLEWIHPAPTHEAGGPSGLQLTFDAAGGDALVSLTVRPKRFGWSSVTFAAAPDNAVAVRQLIYP